MIDIEGRKLEYLIKGDGKKTVVIIEDPVYSINEMIEEGIPKIEAERIEKLSQELSSGLKELSSMSEIRVIKNSNHCINETRPDAVIDAIKELLFTN